MKFKYEKKGFKGFAMGALMWTLAVCLLVATFIPIVNTTNVQAMVANLEQKGYEVLSIGGYSAIMSALTTLQGDLTSAWGDVTDVQTSVQDSVDGVYVDSVNGVPGTAWPIGTPGQPVNNLANTKTIMAARNLKKLYLVGARTFAGTHTAANHATVMTDANADPFKPDILIGLTINNTSDGSSGVITDNDANTITVGALVGGGLNIWTTGDLYTVTNAVGNQPYTILFDTNTDLELVGNSLYDITIDTGVTATFIKGDSPSLVCRNLTNAGILTIRGNCLVTNIITTGVGSITEIDGECETATDINNFGSINIFGNCKIHGGILDNNLGPVIVYGSFEAMDIQTDGPVTVWGNCTIKRTLNNITTGTIEIKGNYESGEIFNNGGGTIIINGDCKALLVENKNGSSLNVYGKLDVSQDPVVGSGYVNNTGAVLLFVGNDCHIAGDLTNTSGVVTIVGKCFIGGALSNGAGVVTISGLTCICGTITNAGTLTYSGNLREVCSQETAIATDVNGVTWEDLLDMSTSVQTAKICGFMITSAGVWAGDEKIRITDGAGNKIFPFGVEWVEATDFTTGVQVNLNVPLQVRDYKFQFRSSNGADGAGETLTLNNLDVVALK